MSASLFSAVATAAERYAAAVVSLLLLLVLPHAGLGLLGLRRTDHEDMMRLTARRCSSSKRTAGAVLACSICSAATSWTCNEASQQLSLHRQSVCRLCFLSIWRLCFLRQTDASAMSLLVVIQSQGMRHHDEQRLQVIKSCVYTDVLRMLDCACFFEACQKKKVACRSVICSAYLTFSAS
jgi:hypothetical protein